MDKKMSNKTMFVSAGIIAAIVIVGALTVWGVKKAPQNYGVAGDSTIKIAFNEAVGNYLTDKNGLTLYYFDVDKMGSPTMPAVSNCYDACEVAWPIFYEDEIKVPASLKVSDFSEIKRRNDASQTVYQGMPLYYYVNDAAPGDIKGEGLNNVWFTVKIK